MPARSNAQAYQGNMQELSVHIDNIENESGYIVIAIFNEPENFLSKEDVYDWRRIKVEGKKSVSFTMKVEKGEYALAVYHDLNNDRALNKSMIGIPQEPYGFSGRPFTKIRPPKWSDAVIKVDKDESIRISID